MNATLAKGERVRLIRFDYDPARDSIDDNLHVPTGTEGTVQMIDDAGTIFVHWDNGSGLGLIPGRDQFASVLTIEENPYT